MMRHLHTLFERRLRLVSEMTVCSMYMHIITARCFYFPDVTQRGCRTHIVRLCMKHIKWFVVVRVAAKETPFCVRIKCHAVLCLHRATGSILRLYVRFLVSRHVCNLCFPALVFCLLLCLYFVRNITFVWKPLNIRKLCLWGWVCSFYRRFFFSVLWICLVP